MENFSKVELMEISAALMFYRLSVEKDAEVHVKRGDDEIYSILMREVDKLVSLSAKVNKMLAL